MKRTHEPYHRRTLALRGTVAQAEAQLDHQTHLAIAYARRWLNTGPGKLGADVMASGTIRRALAVYVQHLESPGMDPLEEAKAASRACSASKPDAEARQGAWTRLEDHPEGVPLPPWHEVLHGPAWAAQCVALDDLAQSLSASILKERRAGRRTVTEGDAP